MDGTLIATSASTDKKPKVEDMVDENHYANEVAVDVKLTADHGHYVNEVTTDVKPCVDHGHYANQVTADSKPCVDHGHYANEVTALVDEKPRVDDSA
ncbi:hypothetical protein MRX96_017997 [Rhipicephalus microplus]